MTQEYTLYELLIIQYTRKLRIPILKNPILFLLMFKQARIKGQRIATAITSNLRDYRAIMYSYIATFVLSILNDKHQSTAHIFASNAATAYFGGQISNEKWLEMRQINNVIITVIEDTFAEIGLNPL